MQQQTILLAENKKVEKNMKRKIIIILSILVLVSIKAVSTVIEKIKVIPDVPEFVVQVQNACK